MGTILALVGPILVRLGPFFWQSWDRFWQGCRTNFGTRGIDFGRGVGPIVALAGTEFGTIA